ncbi:nickel pincer cofactor biosynthesis protein LarB [Lyngbya confervoides]|uniref:Nickel pincer cofactor biosynthesis protein LarB n=1 Tax=Lyngbya confervoides BDU141951 TaxID=1574623 RepID=A0ABD4T752_9CYAN|nr:nickel pincer cofactor biosynthesis protein LarB [Lyngbya confervoides]MCM1984374.1 nickel pincer cofactor biosynthesis protein LarB [Lyngbya confervoides BDU141951]
MGDSNERLQQILRAVAARQITPEQAGEQLKFFDYEPVGEFARVDHHRSLRTGFPEVIWGPGKTVDQIVEIFKALRSRHCCALATRITPQVYAQIKLQLPESTYFSAAQLCALGEPPTVVLPGHIGIVCAGTSDIPVAEEAALVATYAGCEVTRYWDIGVAGLHRLLSNLEAIAQADVLIVVAGMEGALASVVAGLVDCPVIAVPTSVGYGTNLSGIAPLLTMLNSCATGVGVVNIDNGFGAAMLAGKILRSQDRLAARLQS